LTKERRTLLLDDLTPEQERAVGRIQLFAILVVVVMGLGSGPINQYAPGGWWAKFGMVVAVIALDTVIATVLIARVLRVSAMTVVREGVRSVRNDANKTLARALGRLRR
jgi:hypothetical protein